MIQRCFIDQEYWSQFMQTKEEGGGVDISNKHKEYKQMIKRIV